MTEAYIAVAEQHGISPTGFLAGGHGSLDDWGAHDRAQIDTAVKFLSQFRPTKTRSQFSYGLKHRAESWGRSVGMESYVSNGALLIAAYHLGLRVEQHPDSLNGDVYVSSQSSVK